MNNEQTKIKSIAQERVEHLLNFAYSVFERKPHLAHRYTELAWKIKTRYNLKLNRELKRRICRKCQSLLVPENTCRVRLRPSSHITITCLRCGYVRRIPYENK